MSPTESHILEYCLKRLSGLRLLYLFGSQASGDARSDSDWDIAFLADGDLDNVSRWHIAEELAAELGQDVDLVDLKEASTVLKMQIVQKGRLLYGASLEADLFTASTMTQYGHLQESRADILKAYERNE
ncbi:MAG: nucleotidyltransferase domain-containing protein [Thalassolituus maritimus]|uniref:Nucleotidyltransferase domain-containing protein n=1 Tax=Thalassolituus maritimus TaxID=484498 RepID=A0A1N7NMS1_9GAMM|nr:nucleotidyltransferase domain-containing protein [Thalassolituus maritimus]TPD54532.1 MAG: nucleotidyltransferase domain-containing protein [Thalassolituus maritimus]SIS99469.1 Nucleotidyltransferase domain-containing protein [Thalassolituus maritimus]|tara:strand:- start:304 stop:690 length:387 start_codon:yes stop_codon:yes gene_type:complete